MIKTSWNLIPPVALMAARALKYMSEQPGITTCRQTADAIGCSISYMEQVFAELRTAGFIESQRGPGGGYKLTRPATQIQIGDVVDAFIDHRQSLPEGLAAIREQLHQALGAANLLQVMEPA